MTGYTPLTTDQKVIFNCLVKWSFTSDKSSVAKSSASRSRQADKDCKEDNLSARSDDNKKNV